MISYPETLAEAESPGLGTRLARDGWIGSYLTIETGEGSAASHTIERRTGQAPMSLSGGS